jgi:hypothetical protein
MLRQQIGYCLENIFRRIISVLNQLATPHYLFAPDGLPRLITARLFGESGRGVFFFGENFFGRAEGIAPKPPTRSKISAFCHDPT